MLGAGALLVAATHAPTSENLLRLGPEAFTPQEHEAVQLGALLCAGSGFVLLGLGFGLLRRLGRGSGPAPTPAQA